MAPERLAPNVITINRAFLKRIVTVEFILFFGLWFVYGMLINVRNIEDFSFHLSTVEAIVDYHQFGVENVKAWPMTSDSWGYNGHTFSNKQPGQAMIGAAVYAQLRMLGVSFARDKVLAAALIIFFTSAFLTALAAVALYRLARDLSGRKSIIWPLSASLAWGLGTTAFAYTGIPHHDVIATDLMVIAFYLLVEIRNGSLDPNLTKLAAFFSGLFLALTITTSMLHFFMVAIFGLYFLTLRRWRLLIPFAIGGVAGIMPMLIYDTINFGNPFLPAAMANYKFTGYDPEVFFFLDWSNFVEKLRAYYVQINWYLPVLWFGLAGLIFLRAEARREQLFLVAAIAVLVFYITNVEGLGTCAYGPRYLLPIMPLCCLGIVGLGNLPAAILRFVVGGLALVVGYLCVKINFVGALQGAMFCNMAGWGFPDHYSKFLRGEYPQLTLFPYLLPLFVLFWLVTVMCFIVLQERKDNPEPA